MGYNEVPTPKGKIMEEELAEAMLNTFRPKAVVLTVIAAAVTGAVVYVGMKTIKKKQLNKKSTKTNLSVIDTNGN